MITVQSKETVWMVIIRSAKEAVHMYFDPLYRISAWFWRLPERLVGEERRQETERLMRPLNIEKMVHRVQAREVVQEQTDVDAKMKEIMRVVQRLRVLKRRLKTLGTNNVLVAMINIKELTQGIESEPALDMMHVLKRIRAQEESIQMLEIDSAQVAALVQVREAAEP